MTIIARIAAQALRAAAAICNAARICGKPADAVNAPPPQFVVKIADASAAG